MGVETSTHLLLHCDSRVGVECLVVINEVVWYEFHHSTKLVYPLEVLEWHTAIWIIWKARNDRIFNNITKEVEDLVEEIKVLLRRMKIPACMFYEW